MVWVECLPQESCTLTAVRESLTVEDRARLAAQDPAGYGRWSQVEMLLALIADRVAENTWATGQWRKPPARPKPVRRPGVEDGDGRQVSPLAARLAAASPATRAAAEELRAGMRDRPLTTE